MFAHLSKLQKNKDKLFQEKLQSKVLGLNVEATK
jgi:hypothetical protein